MARMREALARKSLLDFLRHVWWRPDPLLVGPHTRAICERLDRAIDDYRNGKSTFLLIQVPYQHGKSDMVSRALPGYFLGVCAHKEPNILMTAYNAELAQGFSKDAKRIIGEAAYRDLFPAVRVARGSDNITEWAIDGSSGKATFVGLGGTITGKRGDLIVLDDYCKNRAESRSKLLRDKWWDGFDADLLTRRSSPCIVCVTATPWHVDDIAGRIQREVKNNPDYPRFELKRFPATNEDGTYLFPELKGEDWYRAEYSRLGRLASAVLDCQPTFEGGNRFDVTRIQIHDDPEDFPAGRYIRCWDLASSAKQRSSDDPDYTVGCLGMARKQGGVWEMWIKDMAVCREEAPARDRLILATTEKDGSAVQVVVEGFGAYKDAYATLKKTLSGRRVVRKSTPPGDKEVKAAPLEAVFEAGNIHLMRGRFNQQFKDQFAEFPDGNHDDMVDATALCFHEFSKARSGIGVPS